MGSFDLFFFMCYYEFRNYIPAKKGDIILWMLQDWLRD